MLTILLIYLISQIIIFTLLFNLFISCISYLNSIGNCYHNSNYCYIYVNYCNNYYDSNTILDCIRYHTSLSKYITLEISKTLNFYYFLVIILSILTILCFYRKRKNIEIYHISYDGKIEVKVL